MHDNKPFERQPAMPPGFGEDENRPGQGLGGVHFVVPAVVAALVAGLVAAAVPLATGASRKDAVETRLAQLERTQRSLLTRLEATDARLAALSRPQPSSSARSDDAGGEAGMRVVLEARVERGDATSDELKMLSSICRRQGDQLCMDRMSEMLGSIPDAGVAEVANDGSHGAFDRGAAVSALNEAAKRAASCGRSGAEPGQTRATLTFEPSGVVSRVEIAATPALDDVTKACLQAAFRKAKVPPFEGSAVRVTKSVRFPAPERRPPERPGSVEREVPF